MPRATRFPGLDWTFAPTCPEELAEAYGHAWVQARVGGSVSLPTSLAAQAWLPQLQAWLPQLQAWLPQLQAWLPPGVSLQVADAGTPIDQLPQRPFPPIHLGSLPRDGIPPWGTSEPLTWLAAREAWIVVVDHLHHPAEVIAWAAVASWGWRVVCRVSDLSTIAPALPWIAQRQLPLHLWLASAPEVWPQGWQVAHGADRALWLQHEWPTLHVADAPTLPFIQAR